MQQLRWKYQLFFFLAILMFTVCISEVSYCPVAGSLGHVNLDVYVIAIDGIDGHWGGNASRTAEGALAACQMDRMHFFTGLAPDGRHLLEEMTLNVSAIVVKDWSFLKQIVETASNIVIVSAHGETVPVPATYTKEEWADKISEAMTSRNVTWVHTGGYPLYYYHVENSEEHEWGEEGFRRLMSHIGIQNVTCWPSVPEGSAQLSLHDDARSVLLPDWSGISDAMKVEIGRPLNGSELRNYLASCIWGSETGEMAGAVIKFTAFDNAKDFGLYVHVGTRNTKNYANETTDGDFYRGYVGTAAAIYHSGLKINAAETISEADEAVSKAETEGRTSSLENAKQLFQQSRQNYGLARFLFATRSAKEAILTANNSAKIGFLGLYGFAAVVVGSGCATTIVAFAVLRKQKRKQYK